MPLRSSAVELRPEVRQHEREQRRGGEFRAVQADREAAVGDDRVGMRESLARGHLREAEALVERERGEHVRCVHAHLVEAADHRAGSGLARSRATARRARQSTCAASSLSAGMYSKSTPPAAMKVVRPADRDLLERLEAVDGEAGAGDRDALRAARREFAQAILACRVRASARRRRATGRRPTSAPRAARAARRRGAPFPGSARRRDRLRPHSGAGCRGTRTGDDRSAAARRRWSRRAPRYSRAPRGSPRSGAARAARASARARHRRDRARPPSSSRSTAGRAAAR